MRLEKISISKFRSIDYVEIFLPKNKPLVLFGPNNAGKTNILNAIEIILGERYPVNREILDSDYFMRDKKRHPTITMRAEFDEKYCDYIEFGKRHSINHINLVFGNARRINDNLFMSDNGEKIYLNNENREKLQAILLETDRNVNTQFNYSNNYSLLSKFNKKLHESLNDEEKQNLKEAFNSIKETFKENEKFKNTFVDFNESISSAVKGFVHSLNVDFSAYDPNNYAKNLRINAIEGSDVRTFDEFGSGEQQIILMAFAKAYMEIFKGEEFILILEEPEANLHPLAQKWLKKYIYDLCSSGLQIIISTHSPNFVDISNLEGLVRVYKELGITKVKQASKKDLIDILEETGVKSELINQNNPEKYFATKLHSEQLEGLFADKVLLVEGLTEKISLPIWLNKESFNLASNGIEIVNCMGKTNIPMLYRIYKIFGYNCYAMLDGDYDKNKNERHNELFKQIFPSMTEDFTEEYIYDENFICSKNNFEDVLKKEISNYFELEKEAKIKGFNNKQGIAKYISEEVKEVPNFFKQIINMLTNNDLNLDSNEKRKI